MLGYICKYTPIEIFEAMGEEMVRVEPEVTSFNRADEMMHPNLCSFTKGILEVMLDSDLDGIVLTTCCDSIRRTFDVLSKEMPDKFIYLLDVPRQGKEAAVTILNKRIEKMIKAYENFSGKTFDVKQLEEILQAAKESSLMKRAQGINIGVMGARANPSIRQILEERNVNVLFDVTCTGLDRNLGYDPKEPMRGYSRALLSQFPCMRMQEAPRREHLMESLSRQADGLIYHTVQFCDNYSYDYAWLKDRFDTPMLLLETDNTTQSRGQILTRMEAFLESLKSKQAKNEQPLEGNEQKDKPNSSMTKRYVLGIDSGSTSTDAVIMDQDRNIIAYDVIRTGAKSSLSANKVFENVLEKAGLTKEDLDKIVSTGYGRVSIPFADENVTEISCHGKGAHYFNPAIRTILDIGGQDSKAIHLNENGDVTDFVMNDKCAAGTGRFLEAIARTLELEIGEVGEQALDSKKDLEITSMCTVFAESEVISLIANNHEKSDIANGVCHAVANKAYSLLKRVGLEETYMMTGGVAKNPGVVKAVEERLGSSLYICPQPEIVGAVGAALYALQSL